MTDTNRLLLAAAVAGGYVLGRTKKGRLALTVASYAAGRHYGVEPRKIVTKGVKRLGEIPQVADLGDQLRGELMTVGREAVSAAADRRLSAFADALHERTLRLEGSGEEEVRDGEDLDRGDEEEEEEHAHEGRARGPRARGTSGEKPGDRADRGNGTRKTGDRERAAGGTAPSKKPPPRQKTTERAVPRKKTPSSEKTPSHAGRRR
ncbi:histone protein [Streptomyces sp. NPDC006971]|uniref:histone protein n=1 Tax=Streptomyces sp. NPDC006971 TaxID=3154784 RepID=UPI0033D20F10